MGDGFEDHFLKRGKIMTLEERAEKIAFQLSEEHQAVALDPVTIMIVLGILVEVVKLFMKCHSASGAVGQLADPGFFHRLLMRRVIKNHLRKTKLRGHETEVEKAIVASGKTVSTQEMGSYYSEVALMKN
jgi:hypothetical protein